MAGPPVSARRSAVRAACRAGGLPRWSADIRTVRGRCLRRRCRSRWGVVRVSLDFTGERVDRLATVECATCGRTWRRITPPPIRSEAGYQAVRLTLILPANARRWYSRGRWHREGDTAEVLGEADLGDLDEATRAHALRSDRAILAREARKAKREADEAEAHEATMALLARIEARREAEAEAEAAAAAREVA